MKPTPPTSSVKAIKCPSCGGNVIQRALGQSLSIVCESCLAIIDLSSSDLQLLGTSNKRLRRSVMAIPLGTRGKLHGILWEVIGFMEKSDSTATYWWAEYLLFNPIKGFRWLTEFDGHWNDVITIKTKPKIEKGKDIQDYGRDLANYLAKPYYLFHKGRSVVKYVEGEFYWKVKVGQVDQVADYVAPPEILSSESNFNEVVWSLGQYVESSAIAQAFNVDVGKMPIQLGVAPNQPSTMSQKKNSTILFGVVALCVLFGIQLYFASTSSNEVVLTENGTFTLADANKLIDSTPFKLTNGTKNLEILLESPLLNEWIEIDTDLINADTGQTVSFQLGTEYYEGYDDGVWTEGSRRANKTFSSIPEGNYHLNYQVSSNRFSSLPYTIKVRRDFTNWSNFLVAILLLSFYPLWVYWRSMSFELSRWSQSDFSPYYSQQDDE